MRLSQIAQNVASDILSRTEYDIVELLATHYDVTLREDEIDEIYEMITDGDVVVL